MLELADTSLILINPSPSNVKHKNTFKNGCLYSAILSFPKIEETIYGNIKKSFIFCKIYKEISPLVFENKSESRSFLVPLGFPGGTSITLLKWKFLA